MLFIIVVSRIAQGMLPKLIHPSYRIFIVVLLMTEPSSVNFGFRHKRGTFQQHLATSARHVSPDQAPFSGPRCPPDPPDAWFMLSPMSCPGVLSGTVAIGLPKNCNSIYFQMLRACEKFGSSFTNTWTSGIPANIWMYGVRTRPNEKGAVPREQISRALARQLLMSSMTVGWYDVGELPTPLFFSGQWQFGQHFVWRIWLVVWRPGVLLIVKQIFRMSW